MTLFTPRPYQQIMQDFIARHDRCALWAGMGLGKTSTTLMYLSALPLIEADCMPALVLAPLRVARSTWPSEVAKWSQLAGLKLVPIVGDANQRATALRTRADVYTMNYENLPWLLEFLEGRYQWPFRTVIADESTRLKGFRLRKGTQRAKALARVAHRHVRRWVNLTGTPSPNGLIDLWGQTWFLDAGQRLGPTFTAFKDRWFQHLPTAGGFQKIVPLDFAREEIESRLRDICLSVDAKDWFDLQEPVCNTVYVDLPPAARKLYRDMEKQLFLEIEGSPVEAFNAASKTLKCLQLASGAIYTDDKGSWKGVHDEKIEALRSIIEEAAGEAVLVAYHFQSDLARLQKAFPQARTLDSNPKTIDAWESGQIPLLLAHPASAGHGLNLQNGGRTIVFFSHWWDLEQCQQIIERIGPTRQAQAGFTRTVFIHYLVARSTVDELVMARRESKRDVQDLLMEAMKLKS